MKLLLSSAGATNASIRDALQGMLDKPIEECTALAIPTAGYANPGGMMRAQGFVSGGPTSCPMVELGWKQVGVLELSALPSLPRDIWEPVVEEVDAILVNGGDPLFLAYWMRESGLADLLPTLTDTVYFGFSAGAMVMAPRIGEDFVGWRPPVGDDSTLGLVDFAIFPHLDHPELPENTMADAENWAATMEVPCYAIDDQTAIRVVDGTTEVISEGHWKRLR